MKPKAILPFWAVLMLGLGTPSLVLSAEDPPVSIALSEGAFATLASPQVVPVNPQDLAEPSGSLTLQQALAAALLHNPGLDAFAWDIRAREAAALQAGLPPNPDLAVEMENFAGEEDLNGLDGAETTIALSQLVELGGKRAKRRKVATFETDLAGWDYQSKKLDVLAATAKAFIRVLAAQEQVAQSKELAKLSEKTFTAVAAKVEAGKVSPVEQTRAQVEQASTRTEANKARRELEAARRRLAAFWGAEQAMFQHAVGNLAANIPIPNEEELSAQLKNNPDLARWGSEFDQRQAALSLARAQAIPDLTLSFGVRNLRESDNNALVAGLELPLPLFDRNQGGVQEARANLEKARRERQAAQAEARAGLAEAWQNLAASHAEATTLRDEILPWAQSAFDAVEFGYREGKFDFLQMIDAQRTLFEVKGQYLEALETYHLARTEVERLSGA